MTFQQQELSKKILKLRRSYNATIRILTETQSDDNDLITRCQEIEDEINELEMKLGLLKEFELKAQRN